MVLLLASRLLFGLLFRFIVFIESSFYLRPVVRLLSLLSAHCVPVHALYTRIRRFAIANTPQRNVFFFICRKRMGKKHAKRNSLLFWLLLPFFSALAEAVCRVSSSTTRATLFKIDIPRPKSERKCYCIRSIVRLASTNFCAYTFPPCTVYTFYHVHAESVEMKIAELFCGKIKKQQEKNGWHSF